MSSAARRSGEPKTKSPVNKGFISEEKKSKIPDKAMKELSRMLDKMCLNSPTRTKFKPLGVACGKVRSRGKGRKFSIRIEKKSKSMVGRNKNDIPCGIRQSSLYEVASRYLLNEVDSPCRSLVSVNMESNILRSCAHRTSPNVMAMVSGKPGHQSASQGIKNVAPRTSMSVIPEGGEPSVVQKLMTTTQEPSEFSYHIAAISETADTWPPSGEPGGANLLVPSGPLDKSSQRKDLSSSDASVASDSEDFVKMKGALSFPPQNLNRRRHRGQSSLRTNLEFTTYMNKRVITKIAGDRWVEGTLRGYDSFMNLVLEDTVELRRTGDRVDIGVVIVRGRSIIMVEEARKGISPEIIRRSYYYHERIPIQTIQHAE